MNNITNVKLSMRVSTDNPEGRNILRELQKLPCPQPTGEPCADIGVLINGTLLNSHVTGIHTTFSRELEISTPFPVYADVEINLLPYQ